MTKRLRFKPNLEVGHHEKRNRSLGDGSAIRVSWGNGATELQRSLRFTELILYFAASSTSSKLLLSIRRPSPRLHSSRERSSSSAVRAVKNPPAFPPFLHLMKTRGEDIRPSIGRQSTSHVFRWISAHVLSPASSGGIVLPGLISIPQRTQTMEPARAIRRWQATPRDRPPTPRCLMMR